MGTLGYGYGSEWHMMRYLGRHRSALSSAISSRIGCSDISWLDFPFDAKKKFGDSEWKGLDFLTAEYAPIRSRWEQEWPQTGNVMNWDAVGWTKNDPSGELVLVEAKSNIEEIKSSCGAQEHGGLPRIRSFLNQAKQRFRVPEAVDWLQPYYQYCNRLAMLDFLMSKGIPTQLVFIYFTGDKVPGKTCPIDCAGWKPTLDRIKSSIGLGSESSLDRVTEVFLPIVPSVPVLGE
ncbi:MAG: hypothetical protein KJZ79_16705 [Bryobacteraceae bacterium]|nr:hypothetical protein [Bryobacteraceae bacterium]